MTVQTLNLRDTNPDGETIAGPLWLADVEILGLGGVRDVWTWMAWLRQHADIVNSLMSAVDDFQQAQNWRGKLAVVGGVADSLLAVIMSAPTTAATMPLAEGEDPQAALEGVVGMMAADFGARRINWGALVGRLPQIIKLIQLAQGIIGQFGGSPAPTKMNEYRPLGLAA